MALDRRSLVRFIDEERRKQNLSQNELARRAGLDSAGVSRIFSGQTLPDEKTIEAFAKALDFNYIGLLLRAAGSITGFQDAELMSAYQKLSPHNRQMLLNIARSMVETQESRSRPDQ